MPRANRICFPGALYHLFQRGNNKQDIFIDDADKWHFLKLLLEAKRQFDHSLYCYALMSNHFHLTIEILNNVSISKIMQFVEGSYGLYFNKRYDHHGHLFQGRFKGILVEKDTYLLELSRYVHLNPVKAGLVSLPEHYKWSSYNIYTGDRNDILINDKVILDYFTLNEKDLARKKYKEFVENGLSNLQTKKDWLEERLVRKQFLGSKDFVKKFSKRGQTPFSCY